MNAALPCQKDTSDLIFVHDSIDNRKWLVDGGALVSVIPPNDAQRLKGSDGTFLRAANGTEIPCFGNIRQDVCLDGRKFTHDFIIASVSHSIIGADFLATNSLAPNHRDKNLLDLEDFSIIDCDACNDVGNSNINFISSQGRNFEELYNKYPNVVNPDVFRNKTPKHGVQHHIPTSGHPVQSRVRRLAPDKLAIAKQEIEKLVELGVCKRAKSEWASPLTVAPKPGGGWRVCGDYRRLNSQTTDDKYPVKTLTDFNANLAGKSIFSKVDLFKVKRVVCL